MSIDAIMRVWEYSPQKGSDLLLMLAIADYANDYSIAYPATPTLAAKSRMSERQTKRMLDNLVSCGELYIVPKTGNGRGNPRKYFLPTGLSDEQIKATLAAYFKADDAKTRHWIEEYRGKGDKLSSLRAAQCEKYGRFAYRKKGDISTGKGDILDRKGDISDTGPEGVEADADAVKAQSENPDPSYDPLSEPSRFPETPFGTKVPHGVAEPSKTPVSAVPSLTPQQQDLLRRLQSGKLLARYENPQDVQRLVDLNLIERCGVDGIVLKGQAKPDECADDPKVQELQTTLQQSFLPGSNGNEPAKPVTPLPQTPPPLPEVPSGYRAVYRDAYPRGDGNGYEIRHYRLTNRKRALCGTPHVHEHHIDDLKFVHQCPDCAAKAAARAPGKAKAPREHDVLFKAVAEKVLGYPPENGHKYTRNQCSQINAIKACVMQTLALPEKKTPADYQRGADAIDGYQAWFPKAHPDLTAPTHDAKFATYFNEFWKAEGDGGDKDPWLDGARGWVKRVKGVLYRRDPQDQEKWIPA